MVELRFLHLEDSSSDAELIRERLKDLDIAFEIDTVTDGSTFIQALRERPYDVVLADYHLPGFDAREALAHVKELSEDTPFICVSGAVGEEKAVELLKEGASDYVRKDKLGKLPLAVWRALKDVKEAKDRKLAEEAVLRSLKEKETLIRELYHRTKNTLQTIRGLLSMEASECPDNEEFQRAVAAIDDRIIAISTVHNMLYQSQDLSRISAREYMAKLCRSTLGTPDGTGSRIALSLDVSDERILIDTAIPLGLILNELLSNTLLHAYPDGRNGEIRVRFSRDGSGTLVFAYEDDGSGLPQGFDRETDGRLGFKLIFGIAEGQLLGKAEMDGNGRFSFSLSFRDNLYEVRI